MVQAEAREAKNVADLSKILDELSVELADLESKYAQTQASLSTARHAKLDLEKQIVDLQRGNHSLETELFTLKSSQDALPSTPEDVIAWFGADPLPPSVMQTLHQ